MNRVKTIVQDFQRIKARFSSESRHPAGKSLTLGNAQLTFINRLAEKSEALAEALPDIRTADEWQSLAELAMNRYHVLLLRGEVKTHEDS